MRDVAASSARADTRAKLSEIVDEVEAGGPNSTRQVAGARRRGNESPCNARLGCSGRWGRRCCSPCRRWCAATAPTRPSPPASRNVETGAAKPAAGAWRRRTQLTAPAPWTQTASSSTTGCAASPTAGLLRRSPAPRFRRWRPPSSRSTRTTAIASRPPAARPPSLHLASRRRARSRPFAATPGALSSTCSPRAPPAISCFRARRPHAPVRRQYAPPSRPQSAGDRAHPEVRRIAAAPSPFYCRHSAAGCPPSSGIR